jgi:hypothetical protein
LVFCDLYVASGRDIQVTERHSAGPHPFLRRRKAEVPAGSMVGYIDPK